MASFYIEKIVVTGKEQPEPSIIEFCDGLNFIIGPSNTGKSRVIGCLDYVFGFKATKNKPFIFDTSTGYDCIKVYTRTPNGTVIFERKIGETKITLSGSDPNFEHTTYSLDHKVKHNISDVWLQMIGIDDTYKILASQKGKTSQLTWRSILHMFFVKQDHVTRTQSVLYNPEAYVNITSTPSKAAALFMMTGISELDTDMKNDEKAIRIAKQSAVIEYIRRKVMKYATRENELHEQQRTIEAKLSLLRPDFQIDDLRSEIDNINHEIDDLQHKMSRSIEASRTLVSKIYDNNTRLAECEVISDRFHALRSQYVADVERLMFVIEGNVALATLPTRERCPFCNNEVKHSKETTATEAARSELQHLRVHIMELEKAEHDIVAEKETIHTSIEELENQKNELENIISDDLKPRMTVLKDKLSFYRNAIELNTELEVIKKAEITFNAELFEIETEEEPNEVKFDINQKFDVAVVQAFQEKIIAILQACQYDGANSARLSMETFDLEISGRSKPLSNGGGYCGFLNTVLALAFVEYLEESGAYSPGLLVVDSPLTMLSESEYKDRQDTMKTGFLKYLRAKYEANTNDNDNTMLSTENFTFAEQIIIAEQKEKLPMLETIMEGAKHVKIIEFTQSTEHGRYGFLRGVQNYQ